MPRTCHIYLIKCVSGSFVWHREEPAVNIVPVSLKGNSLV